MATTPSYIAVVELAYTPLVNEDEECIPGNLGALKKGLQALLKEDAEDDPRALAKWAECENLLSREMERDTGAGAQGKVMISDDFDMAGLGSGL